jgi:hypothetical protein
LCQYGRKNEGITKTGASDEKKNKRLSDYLTDDLKDEIRECSPKEEDLDADSGLVSESGVKRLEGLCESLFKINRQFTNI